jgi:hypothetical protein
MILCCDLPRGKFPNLVFNLVVFGHLVSSCVTQATLETRVLPFSCLLQSAPDSASFVLSFALDVPSHNIPFPSSPAYHLSSTCRRNRPLLPESPQLALHKVCTCLLSITLNGSMARTASSVSLESLAQISPSRLPSCWDAIGLYAPIGAFFSLALFRRIISREMYAGLDSSTTLSHIPSFFLSTLYSILLVD